MNLETVGSFGMTLGGGFLAGALIGFALKKVVKLVAVVAGLFFAGVAYLQHQQIIDIKWAKLQSVSQNSISTLATQIPGFTGADHSAFLSNLGIPLTGSMSMGFAVGFLKG